MEQGKAVPHLPNEVWSKVFEHLAVPELKNVRLVSRTFEALSLEWWIPRTKLVITEKTIVPLKQNLCEIGPYASVPANLCYRHLEIGRGSVSQSSDLLVVLKRLGENVQSVAVHDTALAKTIGEFLPQLLTMKISWPNYLQDGSRLSFTLAYNKPAVEQLEEEVESQISALFMMSPIFWPVYELSIRIDRHFCEMALIALHKHASTVRTIHLLMPGMPLPNIEHAVHNIWEDCVKLNSLTIECYDEDYHQRRGPKQVVLAAVKELGILTTQLKVLRLPGISPIPPEVLLNQTALRHLDIDVRCFDEHELCFLLSRLTDLEILNLTSTRKVIKNHTFGVICKNLTGLRELGFDDCRHISVLGWGQLPSLRRIEKLSKEIYVAISERLPILRDTWLEDRRHIPMPIVEESLIEPVPFQEVLWHMCVRMPRLCDLWVEDCRRISPYGDVIITERRRCASIDELLRTPWAYDAQPAPLFAAAPSATALRPQDPWVQSPLSNRSSRETTKSPSVSLNFL